MLGLGVGRGLLWPLPCFSAWPPRTVAAAAGQPVPTPKTRQALGTS